jgi:hypothetical protein
MNQQKGCRKSEWLEADTEELLTSGRALPYRQLCTMIRQPLVDRI